MGEFFNGWRKNAGVVTLLMALAFMGGWGRSFININRFNFSAAGYNFHWLGSFNGSIAWQRIVPNDTSNWSTDLNENARELFLENAEAVAEHLLGTILNHENKIEWKHRFLGFEIGEYRQAGALGTIEVTIWKLSYWSLITPLTLISAFLLLSKHRKSNQINGNKARSANSSPHI